MSALPTGIVHVMQMVSTAVLDFAAHEAGEGAWYIGMVSATTSANVLVRRQARASSPERAIAMAARIVMKDILLLHPRKETP